METVDPIRDREQLDALKRLAESQSDIRKYLLILIGINCGLRVSDIQRLRVRDFRGGTTIYIRETKTGKERKHAFPPPVVNKIRSLTSHLEPDALIFASRHDPKRPITRCTMYNWIRRMCAQAGVVGKIGTHSLRKTYGYHFYQETRDVVTLQMIFNHSDPGTTLRYCGITQYEIDRKTARFRI